MVAQWWQQLLLVAMGGALGAVGRFWLGGVLLRQLGSGFPWGTLTVNLIGSFAAGFVGQALGWYQAGQGAGFIGSVLGAIVLLFIVGKLKGPGASEGS